MREPKNEIAGALEGASGEAFAGHRGYQRLFRPQALTLGIFLPLWCFAGAMQDLDGMAGWVEQIDRAGFGAVWVRDIPLLDPAFGDAGQVFDAFVCLAYLAARTRDVALATGSAIFTLRHPIDLAKSAASIDQLSQGRLILGAAAGDRPREFLAYGIDPDQRAGRYAQALADMRQLLSARLARRDSGWRLPAACHQRVAGADGGSGPSTPAFAGRLCAAHRPPWPDRMLQAWRQAGVNHAAPGIQYGRRPSGEVLQELAEEGLPAFALHG